MADSSSSLLSLLLVVPEAHVRQLDLHFQTAWYDVFHRSRINQICHASCMGPIVWSLLVCGCVASWRLTSPSWVDLGLVPAGALVVAYFTMDRVLGLVMAPIVAALWWGAHLFVEARGDGALPAALIVLAIAGALQTWTHAFEDVPPPLSGAPGWVPIAEWRRKTPLSRQLLAFALSLSVYILVEIASSPRLLGVQVFKLLLRLGYQPAVRAALAEESRRILTVSGGAG